MLTPREHREFAAFCKRYPIDDESNVHLPFGLLQSLLYNINKPKGAAPKPATEFMPFYRKPEQEDDEEMDAETLMRLGDRW